MTSLTEEECSICLEKLENEIAHLTCQHFFHFHCISSWIQKNKQMNFNEINCPMCNQEFEILNIYLPVETKTQNQVKKINTHKSKCNIL